MTTSTFWLVVGCLGQALFTARFVVQWLVSEQKRDSVVPVAFWWLSLMGGTAHCFPMRAGGGTRSSWSARPMGLLVYIRNLMLVGKARRRAARRSR